MKKNIHLPLHDIAFICASCNKKYQIQSTLKTKEMSIDVCAACHPFYIGSNIGKQVKGRAEKFNKKVALFQAKTKELKHTKNRKNKKSILNSFKDLDKV